MRKAAKRRCLFTLLFIFSFCLFLHPILGITKKGSISIHLRRINTKQEVIALSLYDISEIIAEKELKSDRLSELNDEMLKELQQEVKNRGLAAFTHTSDENHIVEWQSLAKGSYLIVQSKPASFGTIEPLVIHLPMQTGNEEAQMNVVIEPAIIQATMASDEADINAEANTFIYVPTETLSLQDVLLLFCMFSGTILILSFWKYQREQREC